MKKNVTLFLSFTILLLLIAGSGFSASKNKSPKTRVRHSSPVIQKGVGPNTIYSNPFTQRFEDSAFPPAGWTVVNHDSDYTWEKSNLASSFGDGLGSAFVNCFDYNDQTALDTLQSPIITGLTATVADSILFDAAYAQGSSGDTDSLYVALSTNGGATFDFVLFGKGGSSLKTAPPVSEPFTPTSLQWKTWRVRLPSAVVGKQCVFAFIVANDFGNNIYIDNIRIGTVPTEDISLSQLNLQPSQYIVGEPVSVSATVKWLTPATTHPASIVLTYKIGTIPTSAGDGTGQTFSWFSGASSFSPTFTTQFTPSSIGPLTVYVRVFYGSDGDSSNNVVSKSITVTHTVNQFPYVENFDGNTDNGWYTQSKSPLNDWAKGTPAKGSPDVVQIDAAHSPPNSWITGINSGYNDNEGTFVFSPVFDFSSLVEDPVLSFYHNFQTELNIDGGSIEYTTDGAEWTTLGEYQDALAVNWYNNNSALEVDGIDSIEGANWTGSSAQMSGSDSGWINSKIILQGFTGYNKVQFRWHFVSDESVNYDGWAIDNVVVTFQFLPASISGTKFNDINSNGIFDSGEPGLPGWIISMADTGITSANILTDANGQYKFSGLKPGFYSVHETQKNGWVQTAPAGSAYSFALDSGMNKQNIDFGNFKLGSMSGSVFYDLDSNGVRSEEESPLANWHINITGPVDTTLVTNAQGNFSLTGLPYGTYKISEDVLFGYARSLPDSSYSILISSGSNTTNLNFGNYLITTITVKALEDADGTMSTSFDRTNKQWHLQLYKGTVSPATLIVDVIDTAIQYIGNEGRFILVQSDSSRWINIGKVRNATPIEGSYHADTINVSGGTSTTVEFINFLPNSITILNQEDQDGSFYFTNDDRVSKSWSLHLLAIEGASTDTSVSDNSVLALSYLPKGKYVAYVDDSTEWTHLGITWAQTGNNAYTDSLRTKKISDTLNIGDGSHTTITFIQWRMKPDSVMYRTFIQTQMTKKTAKIKPTKKIKYPLYNFGNVRDTIFELGVPKGDILIAGVTRKDSVKKYGWISFKGGKGQGRNLIKSLPMTGVADSLKFKKELKNPPVKKVNNKLVGELLVLRLNILGSDIGVTTSELVDQKFGDLIYEDPADTGTYFFGKTIRQLAHLSDSVLTYGRRQQNYDYPKLASILEKLNNAFHSDDTLTFNDTISCFVNGLRLHGYKMMKDVPFLRRDLGIPARNYSSSIMKDVPDEFSLKQNYPNPFNPSTTISFSLPSQSAVNLNIYNVLGQVVATILHNETLDEGEYDYNFDASTLASGVYFYRLSVNGGEMVAMKKMMLLK